MQNQAPNIRLCVGGQVFVTSISTIFNERDGQHFLSALVSYNASGRDNPNVTYAIDRNGRYFEYVLDYLRKGRLNLPHDVIMLRDLLDEANFFSLPGLVQDIRVHLDRIESLKYSEVHERELLFNANGGGPAKTRRPSPATPSVGVCTMLVNSRTESPVSVPSFPAKISSAVSPASHETFSTSIGFSTINLQGNLLTDDDVLQETGSCRASQTLQDSLVNMRLSEELIPAASFLSDSSPKSQVDEDREFMATKFELMNDTPPFDPPTSSSCLDLGKIVFSTTEEF